MSELLGYFVYKNHVAMQHEDALRAFKDFLSVSKPKRILEIGTADGGLTLALRDILDEMGMSTVPIRSFDIQHRPAYGTANQTRPGYSVYSGSWHHACVMRRGI